MNDKEATDREAEKKEEFIYQGPGDTLSAVIHVGDNFAVNAEEGNSEGADFYILKCMLCKQVPLRDATSAIPTASLANSCRHLMTFIWIVSRKC